MKRYLALVGIATMTIALAISAVTLAIPFLPAQAFSSNGAPPQSCSPAGNDQTHSTFNPNCYGGRFPNCASNGQAGGSIGCRNLGTCIPPDASGRPSESTPACPPEG